MKKIIFYIIIFALTFSLVACSTAKAPGDNDNDKPNQEERVDEDEKNDEEKPEDKLDLQIEETIEIEGMEEKMTLNLYDKGITPFRTYIPSDFIAEEASGGEGDAYWFYANYENVKAEDVYLHFFFFSAKEEPSREDKDTTYARLLEGMEEVSEEKRYDWSIKEYKGTNPKESRYGALGKHQDSYFVMITNFPAEYADGFGPRANKMLKHFYWTDTKEYLTK